MCLKIRPDETTLLHETRDRSTWSTAPRCYRVLQVFPTMWDSSDCESLEHTASCSQDVVKGGFGSTGPQRKVASSGLTLS